MTPLLALGVSLLFEGFRPDLRTALGAALAMAGNAMMLRPSAAPPPLRGGVPAAE
jgi:drug/metabolite transporter (DMT)-like permease